MTERDYVTTKTLLQRLKLPRFQLSKYFEVFLEIEMCTCFYGGGALCINYWVCHISMNNLDGCAILDVMVGRLLDHLGDSNRLSRLYYLMHNFNVIGGMCFALCALDSRTWPSTLIEVWRWCWHSQAHHHGHGMRLYQAKAVRRLRFGGEKDSWWWWMVVRWCGCKGEGKRGKREILSLYVWKKKN